MVCVCGQWKNSMGPDCMGVVLQMEGAVGEGWEGGRSEVEGGGRGEWK